MTTLAISPDRAALERRFFTGIALVILATVLIGFSRSFFLRPLFPDWPSPAEPVFYVHGVLFTAWIALFVVQASLVSKGRADLHRRIGPWGAGLAVAPRDAATLNRSAFGQ
jgi:hypothetical protein